MLKRLGRVVWWLGTLLLLVAGLLLARSALLAGQTAGASTLRAEQASIQSREAAIAKRYAAASAGPATSPANVFALIAADDDGSLHNAPVDIQRTYTKLQARDGAISAQLSAMGRADNGSETLLLLGSVPAAAGLAAWAISYILGGSFWRPPRG